MNWLKYRFLSFLFMITLSANNSFASDLKITEDTLISTAFEIDVPYLDHWHNKYHSLVELDKEVYKVTLFTRLKNGEDQFSYYLLDKLALSNNYNTYLIYEYYESERAVWLVNYSLDMNFIDAIEIFYDNAEGAWSTTATINKMEGVVLLTEYDAYSNSETNTTRIKILSNGKLQKSEN